MSDRDPEHIVLRPRDVRWDWTGLPMHYVDDDPFLTHFANVLNILLPEGEEWFLTVFQQAVPLIRDDLLREDVIGFIGQEATHADVHDKVLHEYLVTHGVDVAPILAQIEYVFEKVLAPNPSVTDPKRRLNHLCDRLWLIAAIEHYTAVLGDFSLNCAWDDHDADPTMVDLFRWHGSEEVEHRMVAHDVATYFHDSYVDRIRAMLIAVVLIGAFFQRGVWHLTKADPGVDMGWLGMQRLRMRDSKLGLLPRYRKLFGSNTFTYFRPGFSPEAMGSTAQAVAYLASSPAARAAHL